jgi:SAM-dependent methyltransferase
LLGRCRLCTSPLIHLVADLGVTPLANAYLRREQLDAPEPAYPLRVFLCGTCFLLQLEAVVHPETLFTDYLYFSSYSDTLLDSAKEFAGNAIARFGLAADDRVIEIASNDGYLLRNFAAAGVSVLGIEPAANVAATAVAAGVPTMVAFFGSAIARRLADDGKQATLVVACNVLAHVPDPRDFIAGLRILLRPGGTAVVEFHHVLNLVARGQFDAVYHEHFQYLSLLAAERAFCAEGLAVVDVEEIPAQGGSLRLHAQRREDAGPPSDAVRELLDRERAAGLNDLDRFQLLGAHIARARAELRRFLAEARGRGESVVGYGAAAKGSTLLNGAGVGADLIAYTVDRNPHKQGRYLPGSHIPIDHPDRVRETRPDYLLILPWNLTDEIVSQMAHIREWGGRFVVAVPSLRIID